MIEWFHEMVVSFFPFAFIDIDYLWTCDTYFNAFESGILYVSWLILKILYLSYFFTFILFIQITDLGYVNLNKNKSNLNIVL